jgi:hypothetical protein
VKRAEACSLLFVCVALIGCSDPPKPAPWEHMGPGMVRTVEYWSEGEHSTMARERVVIETADRKLRQFDHLCERRIPGWNGMEFKDMVFQYNSEWDCYHIIEFVR